MTVLDVRFSDWIQKGFALFSTHASILLVSGLVAVAISGVTLGLLTGPMLAGMAVIVLNLQDERLARPTLNELFKGFDHVMATIPVTLGLYALAALHWVVSHLPAIGQVVSTVALSVGVALGTLSVFHLVARRVAPRQSAPVWWNLFAANWGPLLGFFILTALIGGVGAVLPYGIGLVVTAPLYLCITGVAYLAIARQSVEL